MKLATSLETAAADECVILSQGSFGEPSRLAKVERTTPSMIVVNKLNFNRRGRLRGETFSYHRTDICVASDEKHALAIHAKWKRYRSLQVLKNFKWDELTDDQIQLVCDALPKKTT